MRRVGRGDLPWALLVGLAVVTVLAVGYAGATSAVAFGPYTTTWEGTSELRSMAGDDDRELVVARNTTPYEEIEANGTVAIVLSPDEPYGPEDAERVARFVERGGTLLVAEAHGDYGNDLLAAVGATTRVDGDPLRDETEYDASPDFPVAGTVGEHPYADGADTFVLNHGTALVVEDATVLAESSAHSYLDRERTGELDDEDELSAHPVLAVEAVGDGQIITVSDPSALINVMLERGDNRVVLANVLADHDRVMLDTSHAADIPPLALALLVFRESLVLQVAVATLAIAGVWGASRAGLVGWLRRRWEDPHQLPADVALETEDVRAYLEREHPDWDPERLERVTAAILEEREE